MSFPPIAELLPHRPPMLWLDEVVGRDGDAVHCRLTIRDSHVFVEDGAVEPVTSVEWMAQAVGALVGLMDRVKQESPRPGYLIAVPEAQFFVERFVVGDVLDVKARRTWGDDTLASFVCEVVRGDAPAATGQLSVYRSSGKGLPLP